MPGHPISVAQAQAKIAFKDAYRICCNLQTPSQKAPWWALARMRNAWLAYHSPAPWLFETPAP